MDQLLDEPRGRSLDKPSDRLVPADLMLQFESLGNNCEFGVAQRYWNAEPLGLFRFAGVLFADALIEAIDSQFEGMTDPEYLRFAESNGPTGAPERHAFQKKYRFWLHIFDREAQLDLDQMHAQVSRRINFLTRKFMNDVISAQKIFVVKSAEPVFEPVARDLCRALQRHGPNTLLWVEVAQEGETPGAVDCLDDGFFKGYIDYFAERNPTTRNISGLVWLDICRNAYDLRAHLYGMPAPGWWR